jgi:hypothetical protein
MVWIRVHIQYTRHTAYQKYRLCAFYLRGSHSVYSSYCHFTQVIKYRKTIFTNNSIVDFLKTREIAYTFDVDILVQNVIKTTPL